MTKQTRRSVIPTLAAISLLSGASFLSAQAQRGTQAPDFEGIEGWLNVR